MPANATNSRAMWKASQMRSRAGSDWRIEIVAQRCTKRRLVAPRNCDLIEHRHMAIAAARSKQAGKCGVLGFKSAQFEAGALGLLQTLTQSGGKRCDAFFRIEHPAFAILDRFDEQRARLLLLGEAVRVGRAGGKLGELGFELDELALGLG